MGTRATQGHALVPPVGDPEYSQHPFAEVECIAAAMTSRDHPEGIEVPADAWVDGGSSTRSYVSP